MRKRDLKSSQKFEEKYQQIDNQEHAPNATGLNKNEQTLQMMGEYEGNKMAKSEINGSLQCKKGEPGLDDYLVQDFTIEQREYIVSQLYPHLKQAMRHFVQRCVVTEHYKTTVDNLAAVKTAINHDVHQGAAGNGPANEQIRSQQTNQQTNTSSSFGAFAAYKINGSDKSQPQQSNLVSNSGSFGNFKIQQQESAPKSSFGQNFSMNQKKGEEVQAPKSTSVELFSLCLDGITKNELTNINPNIFRTAQSNGGAPQQFEQIIPGLKYRQNKRTSVFQKIDVASLEGGNIPFYEKTQEQMNALLPTLQNNFLTKNLNEEEMKKLAGAMQLKEYKRKDQIIKYGDTGNLYYILTKGSVQIIVYKQGTDPNDPEIDSKKQIIKYMNEGGGFGELALLYNDKRSATIEAASDCECYTLDGQIFKTIIVSSSIQKRSLVAGFLNKIKLFDNLDKFQKLKLVDGIETMNLKKGDFVFQEGDDGQVFYIIEMGGVECLKLNQQNKNARFICVRELQKGEHFGELALINNEKRSLSVRVKSETCRLLKLERESFTRILGSIEQFLNKDYMREFDAKLEEVLLQNKRLSQIFDQSDFQEVIDSHVSKIKPL